MFSIVYIPSAKPVISWCGDSKRWVVKQFPSRVVASVYIRCNRYCVETPDGIVMYNERPPSRITVPEHFSIVEIHGFHV